jgi:hypothetical protein
VLELAAENWEETLGYGARSTSATLLTSSRPKGGARHHQRGGLSRREELRGLAEVFLKINRRRKTRFGGFK